MESYSLDNELVIKLGIVDDPTLSYGLDENNLS
jgi:hypothetical protein